MSGNRSKSAFFEGVGHFESADFRGKPTNHCWRHKTGVIAVSCGIKISAVHHLVLSQYTRLTDRRKERQTERQTDRQNCDSNTVRCITCSRTVKITKGGLDQYDAERVGRLIFATIRKSVELKGLNKLQCN